MTLAIVIDNNSTPVTNSPPTPIVLSSYLPPRRIAFAGSPIDAVPALEALVEAGLEVPPIVRPGGAWTTLASNVLKIIDAVVVDTLARGAMPPAAVAGSLWEDSVCCGVGIMRLLTVQPAGRAVMAASDWLNGARLEPGARLGD